MAPAGKTSVVLEYFCDEADSLWEHSDDDMVQLGVEELSSKLELADKSDTIGGFVVRSRDAYPRYDLGYQQHVNHLKAHLATFQNLSLVGRGGTFRYNNTDHAIETGLLAARSVLGEEVNPDTVNGERRYLEEAPRRSDRGLHQLRPVGTTLMRSRTKRRICRRSGGIGVLRTWSAAISNTGKDSGRGSIGHAPTRSS